MHKAMHATIRSMTGMEWKYRTAEAITIMHDGTVKVYSRDTDDKPVTDELTIHGPFGVTVIETSEQKEKAAQS